MARKADITEAEINKRRAYALNMKFKGYTANEILKEVNGLAKKMNWGEISLRTLKRDLVTTYEEENGPLSEADELSFVKKEVMMDQTERVLGKLYRSIEEKTDWQPFEEVKTMQAFIDMTTKYAKLANWVRPENSRNEGWDTGTVSKNHYDPTDTYDRFSMKLIEMKEKEPEKHAVLVDWVKDLKTKLAELPKNA